MNDIQKIMEEILPLQEKTAPLLFAVRMDLNMDSRPSGLSFRLGIKKQLLKYTKYIGEINCLDFFKAIINDIHREGFSFYRLGYSITARHYPEKILHEKSFEELFESLKKFGSSLSKDPINTLRSIKNTKFQLELIEIFLFQFKNHRDTLLKMLDDNLNQDILKNVDSIFNDYIPFFIFIKSRTLKNYPNFALVRYYWNLLKSILISSNLMKLGKTTFKDKDFCLRSYIDRQDSITYFYGKIIKKPYPNPLKFQDKTFRNEYDYHLIKITIKDKNTQRNIVFKQPIPSQFRYLQFLFYSNKGFHPKRFIDHLFNRSCGLIRPLNVPSSPFEPPDWKWLINSKRRNPCLFSINTKLK